MKALEARAKKTGIVPKALENRPKLLPHDLRYIDAFSVLSKCREIGMAGPQPIRISEMLAFYQLMGIDDTKDRVRYTKLIQALDAEYLQHAEKRIAAAKAAAKS